MRIADATWMQIAEDLKHDDRCLVPLGSTEQHAYLSLCVDAVLAEKVAVDAAAPPQVHNPPGDLTGREGLSPEAFRERLGYGSFGGYYERPEAELLAVWDIALEETRELLEGGWGA